MIGTEHVFGTRSLHPTVATSVRKSNVFFTATNLKGLLEQLCKPYSLFFTTRLKLPTSSPVQLPMTGCTRPDRHAVHGNRLHMFPMARGTPWHGAVPPPFPSPYLLPHPPLASTIPRPPPTSHATPPSPSPATCSLVPLTPSPYPLFVYPPLPPYPPVPTSPADSGRASMAGNQFLITTAHCGRGVPQDSTVAGGVGVVVRLGSPATRTELHGLRGI